MAPESVKRFGDENDFGVMVPDDRSQELFLHNRAIVGGDYPRAKEVALRRLREASDEELAVFEDRLRQDALATGATEQELRVAQSGHPGHG
jgi:hypothetical protein